jgi:CYTH domain-containing protein
VHRLPAVREQIEPAFTRHCESIDRADPLGVTRTAEAAADLAAPALDEMEARLAAIGEDVEEATVHEARIAGKRVRYLLEPFARTTPGGQALLKRLRRFQDELGDLHDLDVLLRLTHAEAADPHLDAGVVLELAALAAHVEGARRTTAAALRETLQGTGSGKLLARARAFFERLRPAEPEPVRDVEIERKYLLRSMPRLPEGARVLRIDQGYVPGERLIERVRRVREGEETRHYRTVKLGSGIRRIEVEEETDPTTFRALWRLTRGRRIKKRRYVVEAGGRTWQIDRFVGRGLVLAEVELPDETVSVDVPAWLEKRIVREVTGEPEYLNVNLAG